MKSFEYTIKDELGIHVRPAGLLSKEAKKFQSKITIEKDTTSTDASRLMAIMAMGVKQGQSVKVTAQGDDEDVAIEAMKAFFEANL